MRDTTAQELVARLTRPPFGTETSERKLMSAAADWITAALAREAGLRDSLVGIRRAAKARRTAFDNCKHSYYFYTADAALGDDP